MNLDKLSVGMIVKNYKEMCALMDEPVKGGTAKKAQIKEWERYFSFHKEGQKIIIDELFKTVKDKKDGRNVITYKDDGIMILLGLILNKKNKPYCEDNGDDTNSLFVPINVIRDELRLYNEKNMRSAKDNPETFSEEIGCEEEQLKKMIDNYWSQDRYFIKSCLEELKKKGLVMWNETHIVKKRNSVIKVNELGEHEIDENGNVSYVVFNEYREINASEARLLFYEKRKLLTEYGFKEEYQIIKSPKVKDFYKDLGYIMQKRANILEVRPMLKITFNEEVINQYFEKFGGLDKLNACREILSSKVFDRRIETANTKLNKDKDMLEQTISIHNNLKRDGKVTKIKTLNHKEFMDLMEGV